MRLSDKTEKIKCRQKKKVVGRRVHFWKSIFQWYPFRWCSPSFLFRFFCFASTFFLSFYYFIKKGATERERFSGKIIINSCNSHHVLDDFMNHFRYTPFICRAVLEPTNAGKYIGNISFLFGCFCKKELKFCVLFTRQITTLVDQNPFTCHFLFKKWFLRVRPFFLHSLPSPPLLLSSAWLRNTHSKSRTSCIEGNVDTKVNIECVHSAKVICGHERHGIGTCKSYV